MITLAADCLLFQLAGGESVPLASEMISFELMGETVGQLDPDFLNHAAKAVFHYFKHELGRQTITMGEFAGALEKVLRRFAEDTGPFASPQAEPSLLGLDLCRLARESADGGELFFFPRLREELRQQIRQGQRVLRFRGLRGCVKHLVGARRWTPRCRNLEDEILAYLRQCLGAESRPEELALVVE
jgi:hypothetical protein